MTFLQVVNIIRDTALAQPNVNTVVREFLDLNREDTRYSAVVIQDRDGLRDRIVEQDWNTYTFHLGYVDRLTFDESNRDDIFSTGINVINNIVASIRERWDLEVSVIDRFSTFNQRFTASCAGVYVVLAIQVPISDCVDGEETDLYDSFDAKITENGHYHFVPDGRPVDEIDITVDVPMVYKPEESLVDTITSNGSYQYTPTPGSVFSDASIAVDVHPTASLSKTYRANGTNTITGEFNGGTIRINVHPSNSLVETITENGTTSFSGEWRNADITVAVPTERKPEQVGHFEVTDWGTSYLFYPDPGYVLTEVEVLNATPVMTYTSTVTSNGSLRWEAGEGGSLVSMLDINVDVHPSQSLAETITTNGSYHYTGEWSGADITVAVPEQKPEDTLVRNITNNDYYTFTPAPGTVYDGAQIYVDVHPTETISETYTTNGTKTITGEYNGGTVVVDVHPSLSLSETYYSNGTYTISDENAGGTITVLVPDGELPVPADDEIYYLTYTGEPIVLYNSSDFGANLVSNTYQNGYGILKFDGPVARTGSSSFYNRIGLKKVVLPYSVTEISDSSFANTGLQVVIMQNTVVSIGDTAFSGCFAMTTPFKISTGCELLSDGSFKDCTALTTITIPGRCTRLEPGVFKGCSHLFNIYCNGVVPPVMDLNTVTNTYDQFEGCRQDFVIRVPAGSLQAYQTATGWSDYASRIVSQ